MKFNCRYVFAALAICAALGSGAEEPKLVWVENGRCNFPIVATADRPTQKAAKYLADCVEEMTGIRPEVKKEWSGRAIRLGTDNDPRSEAFSVVRKDGGVYMSGAAYHAAYDFCEKVLGVRHYWDAKDGGRSVRKTDRLVLDFKPWSDRPHFKYRTNWNFDSTTEWGAAHLPGDSLKLPHRVHAPHRWSYDTNRNYRVTRPEIFELGRHGGRSDRMLCYGNPKTLETYKQRITDEIERGIDAGGIVNRDWKTITVSQWDGGVNCRCEYCEKLRDRSLGDSGDGSPIIWGYFVRELSDWLKAKYPEYVITILPYINTCEVPPGLVYTNGNVVPLICVMPGLAMLKQPEVKAREEALLRRWQRACNHKVMVWHYVCWPAEFTCAPYVYGHTIADHYRDMRDVIAGTFVNGYGAKDSRWRFSLNDYVLMKVQWNPDVDVEKLYDEFATSMFGPAARPIRELITMQETGWNRRWRAEKVSNRNIYEISYPRAEVLKMLEFFAEAEKLAAGDELILKRLAFYRRGFEQFFRESEEYASGSAFQPLAMQKGARPVVDGALDESDWAKAEMQPFVAALDRTNSVTRYRTDTRVLWTPGEGVTFGVKCFDPDVKYLQRRETLEFFFDPTGNGEGEYGQIILSVSNDVQYACHKGSWRPEGIEHAIRFYDDRWEAEVFVPFSVAETFRGAQIPTTAAGGRWWNGNVCRIRYGRAKPNGGTGGIKSYFWTPEFEMSRLHTRYSNWNRDPAAFGRLQFVE